MFPGSTDNSSTSSTGYTGVVIGQDLIEQQVSPLLIHGWILWAVWSILGFLQIASGRYMRTLPFSSLLTHIISGLLIFGITIGMSVVALNYFDG